MGHSTPTAQRRILGLQLEFARLALQPLHHTSLPSIRMVAQAHNPHYLLFSEVTEQNGGSPQWKFVLQSLDSQEQFAAGDIEPGTRPSRLELLAVVRGLEAIDRPARVTLVTKSRYVARGIRRELNQWRDRQWQWERFGVLVPIRDRDLWQRVDRALKFHQIECVRWRGNRQALPALQDESPVRALASPLAFEPALLIVPRRGGRGSVRSGRETAFARAVTRLRDGVLAPFSAILGPAFTRAA